ncbi:MAG: Nucleotidyltransferase substrate binding protein, HI0074 family [candidate division TM6 bacterium GW2011_GWF2_30_66]|nr:MAG: Nucleotidyltransferase substrate binding protein, HI0074 family [candidate division TM6 bacterium GW2011_GWF2_30_66]
MEKLKLKYNQLNSALERLSEAVVDYEQSLKNNTSKRLIDSLRDSMIQRFEFSLDLFWKYLKIYLEKEMGINIDFNSPKNVVRESCKTKLLSEDDTKVILIMIDDRNMSSHIYKEEIADDIAKRIPMHFKIMEKYTEQFTPKTN